MKLSKKGRDRLYGSHNVFYDNDIEGDVVALYELSEVWEFEPDDFQGMVCLTVKEARLAVRGLALGAFVTKDLDKEMQYQSLALDIEKRIEQVEKVYE